MQKSMVGSRPATHTNSGVPTGYAITSRGVMPRPAYAQFGTSPAAIGSARGGIASLQATRSASASFSMLSVSAPSSTMPNSLSSNRSFSRSFSAALMSPFAVKACDYTPDDSDELDVEFAQHLQALRPELSSNLHLFRKAPGNYEIEGRRVILHRELDDEEEEGPIVVQEEGTPETFTPIDTYLQQSAHVATFMTENPSQHRKDLTFGDARIPNDTDPFTARLMCMQLACEQAEQRQVRSFHEGSGTADDQLENKPEKPRSWWESWEAFFRPRRREDRDEDASEEEGCY